LIDDFLGLLLRLMMCFGAALCLLTLSSISSYVASDAERLQLLEVTTNICVGLVSHMHTAWWLACSAFCLLELQPTVRIVI